MIVAYEKQNFQMRPFKTLQERIQVLSTDELSEIISNYGQFEKEACIGDCLLRCIAEGVKEDLGGISGFPVVLWLEKVAFEAYRELSNRLQHLLSEEVG